MDPAICKPYFDFIDTDSSLEIKCVEEEKAEDTRINRDTKIMCDASCNYLPIKTENSNIKIEGDSYEETWIEPDYVIKSEIDEESLEETKGSCISKYETELNRLETLKDPLESKIHSFVHNNQTEVQMQNVLNTKDLLLAESYKCEVCVYETNRKGNLTRHMLKHTDSSLLKLYACDKCNFKSKYQESLSDHQLMHIDPLQIRMYNCEDCEYKAKRKRNLIAHQLRHRNPTEIQMYRCDKCEYETKYKCSLFSHQVVHKSDSEVQMYKCDVCGYETKHKKNLLMHRVRHMDGSKVKIYKCEECKYKSSDKVKLECHQLWHKSLSVE